MHPSLRVAIERLFKGAVEVTIRNGRRTQRTAPAFGQRLRDRQIADVIAYLDRRPLSPATLGGRRDDGWPARHDGRTGLRGLDSAGRWL